ncbi:glycosyl transferase [Klebsiella oxytoca]|uniref:glycosyl transferase n=1 Tax=Klebsiella oxytoca TaxID=571 RepID=UPI001299D31A|nr:glycosyl transferase [Klebsiella oxytoca]MRG04234.1 glycosyl transferase [Klebsiella oxytoca]MRG42526.1 glycosyl transferase [Klebsiella oxytoca]
MNVAILVVLYDKLLEDSNSLKSLLAICPDNVSLTVINNGPEKIINITSFHTNLVSKFKCFKLIEYVNNKPLSILYNDFINSMPDVDYYILFDDDSIISSDFISVINNLGDEEFDILVPKIKSIRDERIYYPVEEGVVVEQERALDPKKTFSIGSGMIISNSCVNKILMNYPTIFDERYAFYGVDMSIFRRIRLIIKKSKKPCFTLITRGMVLHSLSRIDSKLTIFRASERLIDATLTFRNYFGFMNAIDLVRIFARGFSVLGWHKSLSIILTYVFSGCHHRSKKWNSN